MNTPGPQLMIPQCEESTMGVSRSIQSLALLALRFGPLSVAYTSPFASSFVEGLDAEVHLPPGTPLREAIRTVKSKHGHRLGPRMPSQSQQLDLDEDEDEETELRKGKWWHSTASGVIGGICCVYAGQPFDTVKVRLQTQSNTMRMYSGPLDCFRKTVTQGGYTSLYKGATPALASVVLENAVLFTAHSKAKAAILAYSGDSNAKELTLGQEALAGGVAGLFSSTAITPAEYVKCKLQVQEKGVSRYSGPVEVITKTLRKNGLRGMFSGLPSLWMRDIPFNFVFLGSYEAYCTLFRWQQGCDRENLSASRLFICGGLAGVTGWSIIFPMDVVKSRIQTSSSSLSTTKVISNIVKQEGLTAFYRGWSAAVMRAFPANAALLLGVEMSKKFFSKFD